MFSTAATRGRKSAVLSSWKLEASATTMPSAGKSSACSDKRRADVAADEHGAHLAAQELAGQRGRGRLAVGAGDGDDLGLHRAPGQLELAHDRHAARADADEGGQRRAARPGSPRPAPRRRRPRRDGRPSTARSRRARARAPPRRARARSAASEASTVPPDAPDQARRRDAALRESDDGDGLAGEPAPICRSRAPWRPSCRPPHLAASSPPSSACPHSEGGSAPLPIPPPETGLRRRSRRSNTIEFTHIEVPHGRSAQLEAS